MTRVAVRSAIALGALGLALGAAAALAVPTQGAYLAGPGTKDAYLNGVALLPGTAILPGETVTTSSGGVVVLTPTQGVGGVVELAGNGEATVGGPGAPLQIGSGDALVVGGVAVATPQGETITPRGDASYVVNAGASRSGVGVLAGTVFTFSPGAGQQTLEAGHALQLSHLGGQWQINPLQMSQLVRPDPKDALPTTIPASQSQ